MNQMLQTNNKHTWILWNIERVGKIYTIAVEPLPHLWNKYRCESCNIWPRYYCKLMPYQKVCYYRRTRPASVEVSKRRRRRKRMSQTATYRKIRFLKHCQISKGVTKKIMFTKVIWNLVLFTYNSITEICK